MKRTLIGAVAVLAIAASACSSSTPTGTTGSDSPTPTASADGSADFLALAKEGFGEGDLKVTFEIRGSGSDTTVLTWARMGAKNAYTIGSGSDASLIIEDGEGGTISCNGDSCFKYADDSGSGSGLGSAFIAPFLAFSESIRDANDLPGFASDGEETIAGRTASCASWSYFGSSTSVCADASTGTVLRWKFAQGADEVVWEVTELGTPTDADFEPTGPVQELPSSG